jgi:hypothetical protein
VFTKERADEHLALQERGNSGTGDVGRVPARPPALNLSPATPLQQSRHSA